MTHLLLGAGQGAGAAGGGGGGAESTAFLARTSGLDTTHSNAYIALIDGLVADAVWAKLDMLHVYATQDATTALLNLVSTSYNGTTHGTPGFTADRGYQGVDGSGTVYIDTGFTPSSASSPKFVQNSAHISAWSVTNAAGTANGPIGLLSSGNNTCLFPKYNDNVTFYSRINGPGLAGASLSNAQGHFIANRLSSSTIQGYRNGSSVATNSSDTSAAVGSFPVLVLAVSNGGTPTGSPHQLAMASIGSSLSSTDVTNFYNRLRTFMTVVGVP